MLMKLLRVVTLALTALTVVVFVIVFVASTIAKDRSIPEIKVPDSMLEVSVEAKEVDLLKDVTAFDKKDGDITDRLLVESISRFSETGYCKVTYAVCDYDNHVSTATRQIHYTDYKPPKFKVNRSPVFSIYKEIDTNGLVGATDCLDGDISQNVLIYSPDFKDGEEGEFTIQATVTNSKGDTAEINLPMIVEKTPRNAPVINLDKYLVYLKKGSDSPDWLKYVRETVDSTGIDADLSINVNPGVNMDKKGIYTVDYYGTDSNGITGHTAMIVYVD